MVSLLSWLQSRRGKPALSSQSNDAKPEVTRTDEPLTANSQPVRIVANDYSHYGPLDPDKREIRILVLHQAAKKTAPIRCSLIRSTLRGMQPHYHALSYCWGNPQKTKVITVQHLESTTTLEGETVRHNGKKISVDLENISSARRVFNITEPLHSGLMEFRRSDKVVFLWADAICINQKDIKERSQQICFMRAVYETALGVLVWLPGPLNPNYDGLGFLSDIFLLTEVLADNAGVGIEYLLLETSRSVEKTREFWDGLLVSYPDPDSCDNASEDAILGWLQPQALASNKTAATRHRRSWETLGLQSPGSKDFFLEFVRLMKGRKLESSEILSAFWKLDEFLRKHAWFWRVWVLQEVGSNTNVTICHAGRQARWEAIAAAEFFRFSFRALVGFYRSWSIPFAWFRLTPARHRERMPVLDLLGLSGAFQATDSRDSLFAIISLISEFSSMETLPSLVAPDYSKTTRRAFTDFTSWLISHKACLDILSYASPCYYQKEHSELRLPTWVPDYSGKLPKLERTLGIFSDYAASNWEKVKLRPTPSKDILCVEGLQADIVSSVIEKEVRANGDWDLFCVDDDGVETPAVPHLWNLLRQLVLSRQEQQEASTSEIESLEVFATVFTKFIRCLTSATFTEGEYNGDKLIRRYQKVEDALESHCADWLQNDPDLALFTELEEVFIRQLAKQGERQNRDMFRNIAGYSLLNRRLFVTKSGKFGLCFKGVRPNDLVVIFDGGPTPYILHEKQCEGELTMPNRPHDQLFFEFSGECYLEEYMDGAHRKAEVSRQIFRIV